MKNAFAAIIILALVGAGYYIGRLRGKQAAWSEIPERVDTVIIRDTIRPKPEVITQKTVDSIPYPVPVSVHDTIPAHDTLYLPRTQIHAEGEGFTAWISGYQPNLDSILVFPERVEITKYVPVPKPCRWSVGIQTGMGITATGGGLKAAPYIGVGISYSLFSW